MNTSAPPQPAPDVDTQGFWDATARGALELCRCVDCRRWMHPPLERCRECGGPTAYEPVSGNGHIFSFVVAHQALVPGFTDEVPYVIGLVELDEQEGLRLVARISEDGDNVYVGQRVSSEIIPLPGGTSKVVRFRVQEGKR